MNCTIERSSSVPVYLQIKKQIREYMDSRGVKPGDRLPTDEEFCAMFGVSRMTARKAVSALVAEGLITRVRGKGTFVGESKTAAKATQTNLVGVIMPELGVSLDSAHSPSHYDAMHAIEEFFGERKFNLNVLTSRYGSLAPETVRQMPVAGAIMLFPEEGDRVLLDVLAESGSPFVAVNCFLDSGDFNRVNTDVLRAGREAVEHLVARGRRKIAFVAHETFRGGGSWHYRGYDLAMRAAGLSPTLRTVNRSCLGPDFSERYPMIVEGLDGVVVSDDVITVALLEHAERKNLRVPDDIAMTSYFDRAICEQVHPELTSFKPVGYSELGRRAAERLVEIMDGNGGDPMTVNLESKLTIRESSG